MDEIINTMMVMTVMTAISKSNEDNKTVDNCDINDDLDSCIIKNQNHIIGHTPSCSNIPHTENSQIKSSYYCKHHQDCDCTCCRESDGSLTYEVDSYTNTKCKSENNNSLYETTNKDNSDNKSNISINCNHKINKYKCKHKCCSDNYTDHSSKKSTYHNNNSNSESQDCKNSDTKSQNCNNNDYDNDYCDDINNNSNSESQDCKNSEIKSQNCNNDNNDYDNDYCDDINNNKKQDYNKLIYIENGVFEYEHIILTSLSGQKYNFRHDWEEYKVAYINNNNILEIIDANIINNNKKTSNVIGKLNGSYVYLDINSKKKKISFNDKYLYRIEYIKYKMCNDIKIYGMHQILQDNAKLTKKYFEGECNYYFITQTEDKYLIKNIDKIKCPYKYINKKVRIVYTLNISDGDINNEIIPINIIYINVLFIE
jgi:hypothetical protein